MKKSDTMNHFHHSPTANVNTFSVRQNHLSLFYFNACSLISKFDELCLLVATYNPEFIAIVDTWLSPEISDSEIYTICSVMITIDVVVVYCYMLRIVLELSCLHLFVPTTWNSYIPIFIHYFGHKVCISVFYCPNSSAYIFDTLFTTLAALNISIFPHFLFVGDFR